MLYREIIAVCSQIHTKHINTLCGQNVRFVNVKAIFPVQYMYCTYNESTVSFTLEQATKDQKGGRSIAPLFP